MIVVAALAAASVLLAAPAPSYDPWAWLLWGREISEGGLSTLEGPAFKPLPVAVTTLLAPLGSAAPWLWVLLARAGAIAALVLAWRRAGALGSAAVLFTGGFVALTASGHSEGLLLAFGLGAWEAWERGRRPLALCLLVAAALIRVEAWPFLLAAGVVAWRRDEMDRRLLAAAAVAVPLLWFVPEYLGSGDLLRSGDRARVPNPGQPALADFPFGASLGDALALVPWPLWIGVAVAAWRRDRLLLAGAAWILLVAVMAEAGFSGEPRYALPGAALIAVSGAAGLVLAARWAIKGVPKPILIAQPLAVALALVAIAVPQAGRIGDVRAAQAYQWDLQADLERAIEHAGGRDRVLACGTPYVGRLRGPLMAYKLHVHKDQVEPDDPPRPPGVVFQSRLGRGHAVEPAAEGFGPPSIAGLWTTHSAC